MSAGNENQKEIAADKHIDYGEKKKITNPRKKKKAANQIPHGFIFTRKSLTRNPFLQESGRV